MTFSFKLDSVNLAKSKNIYFIGDNTRLRDIMLEALTPGEWVDKTPKEEVNPWPKCLFFLGRDCANANRKSRPEMSHVLFALEQLQKSPSSLAIQVQWDPNTKYSYYGTI